MQNILQSEFWTVSYDPAMRCFFVKWHDTGRDMTREEFQEHLLEFTEKLPDFDAKGFCTDSRDYHFVMLPDVQEWHDQVIIPKYIENNLQKIAFIMSSEMITALSIEQTFEEPKAQKAEQIQVRYFSDEQQAKNWMREK